MFVLHGDSDIANIVSCTCLASLLASFLRDFVVPGVGDRNNSAAKAIIFCSTKRMSLGGRR